MSVTQILQVARDRLDKGWHQGDLGDYHSDNGGVCAYGALIYARDTMNFNNINLMADVIPILRRLLPQGQKSLPGFNDAETTTKEDVLNLFDKALADLGGLA